MGEEYRAKVFRSGNSLALRLPKALGVTEGTEMRIVREEATSFRVEPMRERGPLIDLTGIAGSIPDLKLLTPEDRMFEPRTLDWDGKLLPRE